MCNLEKSFGFVGRIFQSLYKNAPKCPVSPHVSIIRFSHNYINSL
jgi:hypothetical protein